MALTVQQFLDDVSRGLFDPTYSIWSKDELLGFVNAGLGEMVKYIPDEFTATVDIDLTASTAQQALPSGATRLIRAVCNMVGTAEGKAVRMTTVAAADRASPSWRTATASTTVREVAYDMGNPRVFHVNPPAANGAKLRAVVLQEPSVDLGDNIPLDNRFHTALYNYTVFRALSKDHDYAIPGGRAAAFYEAFLQEVGGGSNQ